MDSRGYETGGAHKPIGQTIKEYIPGTNEYQATHGVDRAHHNAEQLKSHVPGTEEHRMREAGVVGGGAGYGAGTGYGGQAGIHHGHHAGTGYGETGAGYGAGHNTGPTMAERVKQAIPGTREYEATHGMTDAHRAAEQMKSYIPGTEEHRIAQATNPTGGYGTHAHGAGAYDRPYDNTAAGYGVGTQAGTHKSLGQTIKENVPGTRENEAKRMTEGRF